MRAHWLRAVALGLALASLMLWWSWPRGVAALARKRGLVERDHHASLDAFVVAELGDSFELGDGLRTASDASAELELVDGPRLHVRAATLIRLRSEHGKPRIALTRGALTVFTVEDPVLFETAAGVVKVAPYSRANLRESSRDTYVEVVLGRAELEWESATPPSLEPGQTVSITHGPRVEVGETVAVTPTTPAAQPDDVQDAGEPSATHDTAPASEAEPAPSTGPSVPDFSLSPAPAVTIFDPAPPTRLAFAQLAACRGGKQTLELQHGRRFQPSDAESHAFPIGSTRYRLRCGERTLLVGKVRVVKDAGQRAITEQAPTNVVEADGRSYTVLYQTLLPHLTVRWPSARTDTQSTLVVEGNAKTLRVPVTGGEVALPSGSLGDGEHRLWFQVDGSDARSRTTRLQIRFDNATPLARLHEPSTIEVGPDGSVTLSGVVVDHARVSIRGRTVAVDPAGRFETSVLALPGEQGVALKVELPRRSVVYYVRRFRAYDAAP